jgi:acylphosphatase
MAAAGRKVLSVKFEVFGRVQGVFFRKHTQLIANKYGLKGYVKNTERGTVVGTLQGPSDAVDSMKEWLSKVGSPQSKIDKCVFEEEKTADSVEFSSFEIVRKKSSKSKHKGK